ncbi:MAG: hypothetical protein IJ894_16085, partial [Bacteroidales bacterium]|nr:hypothetical protein [Bacteroidales bacterium]
CSKRRCRMSINNSKITSTAVIDEAFGEYAIGKARYKISPSQMADNNFLAAIYRERCINYPKFHKMDKISKAGFLAVELAISALPKTLDKETTGVVFFSDNNGSLPTDYIFEETIKDTDNFFPSPSIFVYTLPNILVGEICIRHGFKGESSYYAIDDIPALYKSTSPFVLNERAFSYSDVLPEETVGNIVNDMLHECSSVVCGSWLFDDDKITAWAAVFENFK